MGARKTLLVLGLAVIAATGPRADAMTGSAGAEADAVDAKAAFERLKTQ